MSPEQLIVKLASVGIKLWLDDQQQLRFKAPKGALTAELKQMLISQKADIISLLSAGSSDQSIQLRKHSRDQLSYDVSFSQQRFWFLDRLYNGDPSLHIPIVLQVDGSINITAFSQAFDAVIAQQEVLRSQFFLSDEQRLQQRVLPQASMPVQIDYDLSHLSESQALESVDQLAAEQALLPFDLGSSADKAVALIRCKIAKLSDVRHILFVTLHHIVADGLSLPILLKQLSEAYQQYLRDEQASLPSPAFQYIDYVYFQQQYVASEKARQSMTWWQQQLADNEILDLPYDYPRAQQLSHRGASVSYQLPAALSEQLQALPSVSSINLFHVALAALQLLLHRYSGQYNFAIGTPVHGRDDAALFDNIGCFINLLAVPTQIRDAVDQTVQGLLADTQSFMLSAQAHQQLPFDHLLEQLEYTRSSAYSPLFQVLFTLQQDDWLSHIEFPDFQLSAIEQSSQTAKYDLQFHLDVSQKPYQLKIEYNCDIYAEQTAQQLARHYQLILSAFIASLASNEDSFLHAIQLVDAVDEQQLAMVQSVANEPTTYAPLHQQFLQQLQHQPERIAVVDAYGELSYAELECAANRVVNYLRAQGALPGQTIAIHCQPSRYFTIAMLASIKLAGCYIPIDANYPADRLKHIFDEAAIDIYLGDQFTAVQNSTHNIQPIQLEAIVSDESLSSSAPIFQADPDQAYYIIYTSGSTGRPKGAAVSYRNEANLLSWYCEYCALQPSSKFLIISSLGFDLTQKNLLAPLLVGAQLHFSEQPVYDPADILASIATRKISHINCAPSAFYPLVHLAEKTQQLHSLLGLDYVLFGGENINPSALQPWLQSPDFSTVLVNMYGPTECTDITCSEIFYPDTGLLLIGSPIPGVKCLVLDEQQRLLPIGASGELYIGGASLGLGYVFQPDLNEDAFVEIAGLTGKYYRTRDIVRYRRTDDGLKLQFIARSDDQVKLRGYRIELGEINRTLLQQENISQAFTALQTIDQQERLIAYIVSDQDLDKRKLRLALKRQLPDYMLPSAYVQMSALPLSANGKVDRRNLPLPSADDFLRNQFIAPRNLVETKLQEIWQDLLPIETISVADNFFELGGHSLLATQLLATVEEEFSQRISLIDFFQSPSIAEMVMLLDAGQTIEQDSGIAPILPRDASIESLPLSYAQQRLWIIEQMQPQNSAYNIPAAMRLRGRLNLHALRKSLATIVQRHEALRTQFALNDSGEAEQRVITDCPFQVEQVDLSQAADPLQAAQQFFDDAAAHGFDISNDLLIRASLLCLAPEQDYVLVVVLHHIVADGWSMTILQRELVTLYAAYAESAESPLADLPLQYADFSVWQREHVNDAHLQHHLEFWQENLRGIPSHISLPLDKQRPEQQSFNGAAVTRVLSSSLSSQLHSFAKQQSNTSFNVLLSVYALILQRLAKQDDICIGTPVAGREQPALYDLIGFFVNAVVIRCQLDRTLSFKQLTEHLQQASMSAFSNQSVPIEKVLDLLELERNPAYPPVTQVGFSYIGEDFTVTADLPNLKVEYLDFNLLVAKYDLTLVVLDLGDQLKLQLEYNTDLFHAASMEKFLQQFENLLHNCLLQSDQSLAQIVQPSSDEILSAIDYKADNIEKVIPLSSMQRDLHVAQQLQPKSLANTIGYRLEVPLKVSAEYWRQALQCVADQQSICRSVFVNVADSWLDEHYQLVLREQAVDFVVIDASADTALELEARIDAFIYQPQALAEQRLMRAALLHTAEKSILLLSAHHALVDGVSGFNMANASLAYYSALADQDASGAEHKLTSDAAFEHWIYQDLSSTDSLAIRSFWQQQLCACEPLQYRPRFSQQPDLFTQSARLKQKYLPTQRQQINSYRLESEHWQAIKRYCRAMRITPPDYFKLLYCVLIQHYTQAVSPFVITEFKANRQRHNQQSLGCFFTQNPYCFDPLSLDQSFTQLFAQQREFRRAIKPFLPISTRLSRALQPEQPLQFMYNYYHFFDMDMQLSGHTVTPIEMPPLVENAVQFIAKEQDDDMVLDLYYQTPLFDDLGFLQRIELISQQLVAEYLPQQATALAELASVQSPSQLQLLLPQETQHMQAWHDLQQPAQPEFSLLEKLAMLAQQCEEKVALIDDQTSLSYGELERITNQMARYFVAQGVGANTRIAIALPRSVDAVVAMIACIKAGACYVPIDVSLPPKRVEYMLQHAQIHLLVSYQTLASSFDWHDGSYALCCVDSDTAAAQFQQYSDQPCDRHIAADDMLYLIFTSGSTGEPKAAAVSYANAANLYQWYCQYFTDQSKVLVFTALGFDLTQKNLWAPLMAGASIILTRKTDYDSEYLYQQIDAHQISHINCAPSMFYPLIEDSPSLTCLCSLRQICLGGESIEVARLAPLQQLQNSQLAIYNHYGPTECTDIALYHPIVLDQPRQLLGHPNPGVNVYIVDQHLRQQGIGVVGEIAITGASVGLGYMHNDAANQQFVANPFGAGLLYKTGDLGFYHPDGNIEFVARIDHQVKLNGLRIELAEIEAALQQQPDIDSALVLVIEQQLVGYVLSEQNPELTEINSRLAEILPQYMLPTRYIVMQQWPLSANGKIDRKQLPKPDRELSAYVAPSNDIEAALCDILQQVLAVPRVGVNDDFFTLGGHSLAASRAMVQIRQRYQVDIPINTVFANPSVKALAAWISAHQWAQQSARRAAEVAVADASDGSNARASSTNSEEGASEDGSKDSAKDSAQDSASNRDTGFI